MPKKNKKQAEEKKPAFEIKHDDATAAFERDILKENPARLSYITRLFKYVFNSAKAMCGIFLGLAILLSLLQPVTAFVWGRYIDAADSSKIFGTDVELQTAQIVSLVGLALLYWFINFLSGTINRYLYGGEDIERLSKVQDHRLQEKFQTRLLKKISKLYPDYMEVPKINDIINRSFNSMGGEWSSLQRGVMIEGYVIIAQAVSVVMVAASLYLFHPLLCLIVLAAPLPTLYTTYAGNKMIFKFTRDNDRVLREAGYYQGVLMGGSAKEVKALNLFDFFFAKWKALADDYVVKEKKNQTNVFVLGSVSGTVSNVATAAANVFAIILLARGDISVGALGAALALINTLMGNTSWLFSSMANFVSKKHESAQFFELIDLQVQEAAGSGGENNSESEIISKNKSGKSKTGGTASVHAPQCIPVKGETPSEFLSREIETLEAVNVSYRYPLTDEYRNKNVNFKISRGEKVAFVGENGAGKTTFVKLLTGMLQPSAGKILTNSVAETDDAKKYASLSCVFQEPARFNTFTIADNVFLGDVERVRSEDEIDAALNFSGFEGADKEELLGKDIGGTDLSGGQWQKLAIARACYRGRSFMVLDEPTSNLDPLAEAEVFKQYIALSEGKTVIMVTHRISVASLADRVVVFKDGEIVEDGAHETLLANSGEYARLYTTQAEWYDR
ncbi:MAG: ABC transporter ATP-binding protein/permease [Defluviitaleaceae bacterium]|nr:ABC transporter ATP-binding protein/permease [Defluviitaleaceae bacterium]